LYATDYIILAALVLAGLVYYLASQPRVSGESASSDKLTGQLGQAHDWLESQGYAVLLQKPTAGVQLRVGDRSYDHRLRADFLVRKRGRQFAVIVKRGKKWDARVTSKRMRQRFLEIQNAFGGLPVLFVEVDRERGRVIDFQPVVLRRRRALVAGVVLVSIIALSLLWLGQ